MAKVLTNRGWLAAFAAAILCVATFVAASTAFAAPGTLTNVTIGSGTVAPNGTITINLTASGTNIGSYGVNVKYDTTKVTATACTSAGGGACTIGVIASDVVRINGASTAGINGTDTILGTITFTAGGTAGTAALDIIASDFTDTSFGVLANTPTDGVITIASDTPTPSPSPSPSGGASPTATPKTVPATGGPDSDSFQFGWVLALAGLVVVAAGAWTLARAREDS
jgi:hypothetical protein